LSDELNYLSGVLTLITLLSVFLSRCRPFLSLDSFDFISGFIRVWLELYGSLGFHATCVLTCTDRRMDFLADDQIVVASHEGLDL